VVAKRVINIRVVSGHVCRYPVFMSAGWTAFPRSASFRLCARAVSLAFAYVFCCLIYGVSCAINDHSGCSLALTGTLKMHERKCGTGECGTRQSKGKLKQTRDCRNARPNKLRNVDPFARSIVCNYWRNLQAVG